MPVSNSLDNNWQAVFILVRFETGKMERCLFPVVYYNFERAECDVGGVLSEGCH